MRKPSEKSCSEDDKRKGHLFFTALNLIANKWGVRLIYTLATADNRTLRFNALQKSMDGISQRELTRHLREFEACGIVSRKVYAEVPPRVEYTLTDVGLTLQQPIEALMSWAEQHGPKIQKKREAFLDNR